ncbi:hypothetical protein LLB_3164 [Legionella longbeachae D-4968]|nr:hypothetical protein LLB_3164 [Legionella longbeachae D-4968]
MGNTQPCHLGKYQFHYWTIAVVAGTKKTSIKRLTTLPNPNTLTHQSEAL